MESKHILFIGLLLGFILSVIIIKKEPEYDCSNISKESQDKMKAEFEFGLKNYSSTFYEISSHRNVSTYDNSRAIDNMMISLSTQVKSHYCEPVSSNLNIFKK